MVRYLLLLLVWGIAIVSAGLAGAQEKARIKVVASTTQIADFARQIMGDRAEVKSVLAPGADPHTYQPTPDDVQIVLQADICFENGLHLEGKNWMSTLARDAKKPLVTATTGIEPIKLGSGDESIMDPHTWFSPRNVAVYVNNITRAIGNYDPDNTQEYQARAKLYLQQLRVLDAWVREQVNCIPRSRRILVTTHDAFNYFCREYKFKRQY